MLHKMKFDQYKNMCCDCGTVISQELVKSKSCPHCGFGKTTADWRKPPIETALFLQQKKFRDTGDREHLAYMYLVLCQYAEGKIRKILNGKKVYTNEMLEEKSSDAANLLIEYFLKNPDFKISSSFGGYLEWQVKSVLYGYKEKHYDQSSSLHEIGPQYEGAMINFMSKPHALVSTEAHFYDTRNGILNAIKKWLDEYTFYSSAERLRVLMGIYYYIAFAPLRKNKTFYEHYNIGSDTRYRIEEAMKMIYKILQETHEG